MFWTNQYVSLEVQWSFDNLKPYPSKLLVLFGGGKSVKTQWFVSSTAFATHYPTGRWHLGQWKWYSSSMCKERFPNNFSVISFLCFNFAHIVNKNCRQNVKTKCSFIFHSLWECLESEFIVTPLLSFAGRNFPEVIESWNILNLNFATSTLGRNITDKTLSRILQNIPEIFANKNLIKVAQILRKRAKRAKK